MAHDHSHDHAHPAPAEGAGTPQTTEAKEATPDAVGEVRAETKGKVRGVFGRMWDGFKSGVKKAFNDVGGKTRKAGEWLGLLEESEAKGEEAKGDAHDHAHTHAHPKKPATPPANNTPAGAPATPPAMPPATPPANNAPAGAPGNNPPATPPANNAPATPPANNTPAGAPANNAPATPPANNTPAGAPANNAPATPPAAHNHAHEKKGMSTGMKAGLIATGIAGATVVAGTALVANATVEVAGSVIEHGPKWIQTAGNLIKWPFRSLAILADRTIGAVPTNIKEGFEYGREELVGHADYHELKGWTAPLKLAHNGWKSLWQNPVTRFAGGVIGATLGLGGGTVEGATEAGVVMLSDSNNPTVDTPLLRTRKPKPAKKKKEKKATHDDHGHGSHGHDDHGHGGDHGHDAHAEPAHGADHGHAEAGHDAHAEPAHGHEKPKKEEAHGHDAHAEPAHHRKAA